MCIIKRKQRIPYEKINEIAEIPNCPEDLLNKILPRRVGDGFTIYYGGWITETRGLIQLSKAIREIDRVQLIVAGSGNNEEELKNRINQDNVKFIGWLSYQDSLSIAAGSDIIFAFYDPRIRINRLAVSAKIPEAMMFGKPVLGNRESAIMADVILKEECGLVVPYADIEGIRNAIISLKINPALLERLGKNGRKAYEEKYSWTIMENRLVTAYKNLHH